MQPLYPSTSANLDEAVPLLDVIALRPRMQMALLASKTDGGINQYWFMGNVGLIHVEFYLSALDYCDQVEPDREVSLSDLIGLWQARMSQVLGELAPDFVDLADPSHGRDLMETTQVRDAVRDTGFLQGVNAAGLVYTQEEVDLALLSEGSTEEEHAAEVAMMRSLWRVQ